MTSFNTLLLNDMESFDLLCVNDSTCGTKVSRIFQNICTGNGKWAHVGIVIKNDIIPTIKNKIYIWHCSNYFKGVNLHEIDTFYKLKNINVSEIAWCKLKNNPLHRKDNDTDESYNKRVTLIKKKINMFYNSTKNSTFNHLRCINLVFPILQNITLYEEEVKEPYPNLIIKKSYFCSEFLTIIYKLINVIRENIEPDLIFPITLMNYENGHGKIFDEPIHIYKKNSLRIVPVT